MDMADIWINCEITEGETLARFTASLRHAQAAKTYLIHINSYGGSLSEAMAIYHALREQAAQGKTIVTRAEGPCISAATVIFLAGDQRIITDLCSIFLIHNPWVSAVGDSAELAKSSERLAKTTQQLGQFYAGATGQPLEKILALMELDQELELEQVLALGFATRLDRIVPEAVKAYFKRNNRSTHPMSATEKQDLKNKSLTVEGILSRIRNTFLHPQALVLQDAAGLEINFPDLAEAETPQVGDKAAIDGKPAEGAFTLPDGSQYLFSGGALMEIIPPPEAESQQAQSSLKIFNEMAQALEGHQQAIEKLTLANGQLQQTNASLTQRLKDIAPPHHPEAPQGQAPERTKKEHSALNPAWREYLARKK